jgi:hypothetical protein
MTRSRDQHIADETCTGAMVTAPAMRVERQLLVAAPKPDVTLRRMESLKGSVVAPSHDAGLSGPDRLAGRLLIGATAVLLSALVVMTFARPRVKGDGLVYYAFLRKLLGENVRGAFAYQPGTAYWNAPFYLVGRAIGKPGVSIAVASYVACLLTVWFGRQLLAGLGLPHGWLLTAVALIGTPLWYYVVFEPSYTHAADGLVFTVAALALQTVLRERRVAWAITAGACAGFLPAVRYANVFVVPFLVGALLLKDRRLGSIASVSAIATGALAFSVPLLAGIPYGTQAGPSSSASGGSLISFDPTVPFKMLFSLHRGLFLWTPLTLVAAVGYLIWLRRDPLHRFFLVSLGGAAVALVACYAGWGRWWDAGDSFSERFLASLFPIFLIGAAALVRLYSLRGIAVVAVAACVSLLIGLTFAYGYKGVNQTKGVDTIFRLYVTGDRTLPGIARTAGVHARDRWEAILGGSAP